MGWTSLLQPFRALAGTGITKGGKDNALAHRRYLQEMAEREVVRAAASGNIWCSASHPEHVRPMLQVRCGGVHCVVVCVGVLQLQVATFLQW